MTAVMLARDGEVAGGSSHGRAAVDQLDERPGHAVGPRVLDDVASEGDPPRPGGQGIGDVLESVAGIGLRRARPG